MIHMMLKISSACRPRLLRRPRLLLRLRSASQTSLCLADLRSASQTQIYVLLYNVHCICTFSNYIYYIYILIYIYYACEASIVLLTREARQKRSFTIVSVSQHSRRLCCDTKKLASQAFLCLKQFLPNLYTNI